MVRIVIERHLKEGKKGDLMSLLRELRAAAMHQPGYVTGARPWRALKTPLSSRC